MHPAFMMMDPEEYNNQAGLQQLAVTIQQHEQMELFNSLSEESLITLLQVLRQITGAEEPKVISNYWSGWVSSLLRAKYEYCVSCRESHNLSKLIDGEV